MMMTEIEVHRALQILKEQDQLVLLIQIVEKWAEKYPRTAQMALFESEAFCKLCLLDYAWQRVQHVPDGPERRALQVEILLQRGWVSKAQAALVSLQSSVPNHPRLIEFHERARRGVQPPTQAQAQQIVEEGNTSRLLGLAQQCLSFGKYQVGKKILTHILQRNSDNLYARRLLWAHKRDFTTTLTLVELLKLVQASQVSEEVEATVSHTHPVLSGSSSGQDPSFPSLFKGNNTGTETVSKEELTAEVTMAFTFADRASEKTEMIDDAFDEDRGTVALEVIEEIQDDPFEATGAFDKSMFMKESNDEEVVVLISSESKTSEIPKHLLSDAVVSSRTVEVVDKVPQPEVGGKVEEKSKKESTRSSKKRSDNQIVKGAIFAVSILAVIVVLVLWGMKRASVNNLVERSTPIILSADAEALTKFQVQLESQVDKNVMPKRLYQEFLALVYYVQWRDFTNAESDEQRALKLHNQLRGDERSWVGNVTQALIHLDMGQISEAADVIANITEVEQPLVQWASVEVELLQKGQVTWAPEVMDYPRIQILAIENDTMVGDTNSDNAWVQLASLQQELGVLDIPTAKEKLATLRAQQWVLGGAQQATLLLLQSLFQENKFSPSSKMMRKQAYETNPYNPDVQFWRGLDEFWLNDIEQALNYWDACFYVRSACASGYILVSQELGVSTTLVERLEFLPDYHPLKEALIEYVASPTSSALRDIWSSEPFYEDSDVFWQQVGERQQQWVSGSEESDVVWFSAWKAHSLKTSNPKHAFQWALQTIGTAMNYTEMYEILASTADSVNKDPTQFRQKYEQLQQK